MGDTETLLANLQGVAYRRRADERWTVELVSGSSGDVFGVEPAGLVGTSLIERVAEEDRKRAAQVVREALDRGTAFRVDYRIRNGDGNLRWVCDTGRPAGDGGPGVDGYIGDIQDYKDDAEALRRTRSWVESLVQTTQDAVVTIDSDSRIVLFNAAAERMFGYRWEEVRGRDVTVLMPEPYAREHAGYVSRYERTGEARAIGRIRSVTARRRDGETFPAELSVTEIETDGETRYGAFLRDISETVRLQNELVDRERLAAIGTTAAKFAHEVSNPLNGMFTQAQLMKRRLDRQSDPVDDRLRRGVELLLRDIERLNGLLDEFRSMSRRQEYRFRATSLTGLCQEIVEAEGPHHDERGIRVLVDLPPQLPDVRADPPKLKQVLFNLCKNAVEAMDGGGTITVRAEHDGDRVVLEVHDTGAGIPDGVDVFAPFATTKPAGTGLGLPVVRQIIAAHGGSVDYTSAPGRGTTFRVELPVAETPPE